MARNELALTRFKGSQARWSGCFTSRVSPYVQTGTIGKRATGPRGLG